MMNITVNAKRNEIVITKAFAKAASKFGTEEYKALREVKNDFPTFRVVERKSSKKADSMKGLTYNYMEKYIKDHDDENNSIMAQFLDLRGLSDAAIEANAESKSYGEMKAWFLDQFVEIKKFYEDRDALLAA